MILFGLGLLVLLYPLAMLGLFLATFMAAWEHHFFLAFIYWGLTALFLPWWRNPKMKSLVGWVLGLQGAALGAVILVRLAAG